MEWLPTNLSDWGGATLAVVICILILTDRLVTRGRLMEEREEKKLWQATAQKEQGINAENAETIKNYAEAALITEKVMQTLQERHRIRISEDQS